MVARQFIVHHNGSQFPLEYDTDDGFEVYPPLPLESSQNFSKLFESTDLDNLLYFSGSQVSDLFGNFHPSWWAKGLQFLPLFQEFHWFSIICNWNSLNNSGNALLKILAEDQNLVVKESSDLESIWDKLLLVSIQEEEAEGKKEESLSQFEKSDEELARILQVCDRLNFVLLSIRLFPPYDLCVFFRRRRKLCSFSNTGRVKMEGNLKGGCGLMWSKSSWSVL